MVSKKGALLKKNRSVKRVHIETPWTDLSTIDLIGVPSPGIVCLKTNQLAMEMMLLLQLKPTLFTFPKSATCTSKCIT